MAHVLHVIVVARKFGYDEAKAPAQDFVLKRLVLLNAAV